MRYLLLAAMLICAASGYAADLHDERNGRPGDGRGGPPKVYDARGKIVGQLESNSGVDGVFLTVSGVVVFVGIERVPIGQPPSLTQYSATQFQWMSGTYVRYLSADCSGSPVLDYIDGQGLIFFMGPRPSMAVRLNNDVVLYVAGEADSTTVQTRSDRRAPNLDTCFSHGNAPDEVGRAFLPETSYPLEQLYPEPLTIRY